jgi:hypothetical protein
MTDPFVIDNVQTFPDNSNTTLCEGMARIFPANGLPPYHYIVEEDTLSMVGDNIPDLCSGTYNLTVMDSNGCSEVIQFEIENNLGLGEPLIHPYRIYPVPASDAVYVEFIKTDHTKAFAEIRNLQGRKILVSDLEDQITRLDIVDLPPGIYILHIEADEERSDFRIIKLK